VPRVSTYLNFAGDAAEALAFYGKVFGTEVRTPIVRMGDMADDPSAPPLSEAERGYVMHAELPILAGHVVMATDMLPSRGHVRRIGNNTTINLELEDRAEAEGIFELLAGGASERVGLADMPWGAYWGTCLDRHGIRWMVNCATPASSATPATPAPPGDGA
jgi:PhnB protein